MFFSLLFKYLLSYSRKWSHSSVFLQVGGAEEEGIQGHPVMDARPCGTLPCTTITTTTITTTATNTTTSVTAATTSSSSSRGTLPTTHHRQKHHHHHSSSSEGYHYPRVHHQAHQPHTVIPGTDTPKQFSPSGAGDLGLQQYYPVRIARPDGEERAFLQQGGKSHTLSRNHKDKVGINFSLFPLTCHLGVCRCLVWHNGS